MTVATVDDEPGEPVDVSRWQQLAEHVLDAEGVEGSVEVTLVFAGEARVAELNRRYLGGNGPTDVLAFPIDEIEVAAADRAERPDLPARLLGDVVICPSIARANAEQHGRTYEDELALLVVHGLLHLLGMDHADDGEREEMQQRETELLRRFHTAATP